MTHDTAMCDTRQKKEVMCDPWHSNVWHMTHESPMLYTWQSDVWHMTHETAIFDAWHSNVWDMTQQCVTHATAMYDTWHSIVWHKTHWCLTHEHVIVNSAKNKYKPKIQENIVLWHLICSSNKWD